VKMDLNKRAEVEIERFAASDDGGGAKGIYHYRWENH